MDQLLEMGEEGHQDALPVVKIGLKTHRMFIYCYILLFTQSTYFISH